MRANTSYGIDYKAEAIEKAKINTAAAGQVIHYIQKDFFAFEHEYLFDEIFTDMPFALGQKAQAEIEETYRRFFPGAYRVLKADGIAVLYTRDRKYVKQMAGAGRLFPDKGDRAFRERRGVADDLKEEGQKSGLIWRKREPKAGADIRKRLRKSGLM